VTHPLNVADRIFARATHWCVLWCNANLTKLSPKATAGDSSGLLFILIFPEEALNDQEMVLFSVDLGDC
jgi:hypothetical protein